MLRYVLVVALCAFVSVRGHSYSLGGCPAIEPQPNFEMRKMLGLWYAVQKTSTASHCITYNFTKTSEPYTYELEQVSQHFALGLTPLRHEYHYAGKLTVPDEAIPSRMKVKFPLSVAGTAAYTIFMTDYENYAGIFTCQKLGFAHRQSTTILSRERTLDKMYVDKIRTRLSSFNIDPFEMSIISHKDCPKPDGSGWNINIDDETFSPQSIGGVVRKAGEKIGDGVEYIAGGAKKIYHKYSDSSKEEDSAETVPARGRLDTPNPDSEWLP